MIHIADLPHDEDLMAEKAKDDASSIVDAHEKKLERAINDTVMVSDFTPYKYCIARPRFGKNGFPYSFAGTDPLRSGVFRYLTEEYENKVREDADHTIPDAVVRYDVEQGIADTSKDGRVVHTWSIVSKHVKFKDALKEARALQKLYPYTKYRVHIDFPISIDDAPKEQF